MKGIQALIVAAGLGIVGALLNFFYLLPTSHERNLVYFIAVKRDRTINRGQRLKAEDLETVGIPLEQARSLKGPRCPARARTISAAPNTPPFIARSPTARCCLKTT